MAINFESCSITQVVLMVEVNVFVLFSVRYISAGKLDV